MTLRRGYNTEIGYLINMTELWNDIYEIGLTFMSFEVYSCKAFHNQILLLNLKLLYWGPKALSINPTNLVYFFLVHY